MSESYNQSNPRKRRRTAIACKTCSTRKTRCDGKEPKCSSCTDLGAECVYPQPARSPQKRTTLRPHISNNDVLDRLETMENGLRQFQELLPSLRRLVASSERRASSVSETSDDRNHVTEEPTTLPPSPPEDRVDGMGIMLDRDDGEDDDNVGYFGASSNITLLRKVTQSLIHSRISDSALFCRNATPNEGQIVRTEPNRPSRLSSLNHRGFPSAMYCLPTLSEGTNLLRQFFGTVGLMFPCFHEPDFLGFFREASSNPDGAVNKTMLAILNVMFAFGKAVASTSSPPFASSVAAESDVYYNRSIALMGDAFDPSNLETVQLSLILSTYLMGTQQSVKSWNFHALAVGGAIKIGLNSPHAGRSLSPLAKEMRKRAWWWCVIHDRLLSMLFGRCPLIHPTLVQVELPSSIAQETPSQVVTESTVGLVVDHYRALANLAVVMGDVIEKLYNQNISWDLETAPDKIVASSLDIAWKLDVWHHALRQELKPITPHKITNFVSNRSVDQLRLRIFLTLRYKCVQILATRSILFKYLAHRAGSDEGRRELRLLQTSGQSILQTCFKECTELIQLVSALLHPAQEYENVTLFGAWYFSTYHVFNAALTLLAILLICRDASFSNLFAPPVRAEIRLALDQACQVLNGLHNGNPMVKRCAECLPRLVRMYDFTSNDEHVSPFSPEDPGSQPVPLANPLHQYMHHQALDDSVDRVGELQHTDMNMDLGLSSGGIGMNADFDFINEFF